MKQAVWDPIGAVEASPGREPRVHLGDPGVYSDGVSRPAPRRPPPRPADTTPRMLGTTPSSVRPADTTPRVRGTTPGSGRPADTTPRVPGTTPGSVRRWGASLHRHPGSRPASRVETTPRAQLDTLIQAIADWGTGDFVARFSLPLLLLACTAGKDSGADCVSDDPCDCGVAWTERRGPVATIQDAVNGAQSGETVYLCEGEIVGRVQVAPSVLGSVAAAPELTLVGAGRDATVLLPDEEPKFGVLTIGGVATRVQNLTLSGGTGARYVYNDFEDSLTQGGGLWTCAATVVFDHAPGSVRPTKPTSRRPYPQTPAYTSQYRLPRSPSTHSSRVWTRSGMPSALTSAVVQPTLACAPSVHAPKLVL